MTSVATPRPVGFMSLELGTGDSTYIDSLTLDGGQGGFASDALVITKGDIEVTNVQLVRGADATVTMNSVGGFASVQTASGGGIFTCS